MKLSEIRTRNQVKKYIFDLVPYRSIDSQLWREIQNQVSVGAETLVVERLKRSVWDRTARQCAYKALDQMFWDTLLPPNQGTHVTGRKGHTRYHQNRIYP